MKQNDKKKSVDINKKKKKRIVLLCVLAFFAILITVAVIIVLPYIRPMYLGISKSEEQIQSALAENDRKTDELLNKLSISTMRNLTDEERKLLAKGDLSKEEALALIRGETLPPVTAEVPLAPVVTEAPATIGITTVVSVPVSTAPAVTDVPVTEAVTTDITTVPAEVTTVDTTYVATEISDVTTKAPDVTTDEPGVTTKAPEVTSKKPVVTTKTPEATSKNPGVTTKVPEVTTKAPVVTTKTPDVTTKTPEVTTKTPEVTTKEPVVITKAPEVVTKTPEVTTKTPEVTTKSPAVTTTKATTTKATTTAPKPVTPPTQAEAMQNRIEEIIAEIYLLRATYLNEIDALIAAAKQEYVKLPKAQRNLQSKMRIIERFVTPKGKALEAQCDSSMFALLKELEGILKKMNSDTSIIAEIKAVYQEQKDWKMAEIYNQYSPKLK